MRNNEAENDDPRIIAAIVIRMRGFERCVSIGFLDRVFMGHVGRFRGLVISSQLRLGQNIGPRYNETWSNWWSRWLNFLMYSILKY